jgi:hypothetical protein
MPAAEDAKVTVTVQLLPAAIEEVHVVVSAKSPLTLIPLSVTAVVPVLLTVTDIPALVVPVGCCGNERLLGETATVAPAAVPVPVSATTWGLLSAESVKVREPVAAPAVTGVNVTPTVHVAPAATLDPQVLLATAKAPLVAMLVKVMATLA